MVMQINPDELIALLEGEYQARAEPNFALAKAASTILALPALRGFWPMSSVGVTGEAQDLQSLGNHLTRNGTLQFGYENLIPYCGYDGTGDYNDITDAASGNAFDILGTETFIAPAYRGLTCGCWVRPEETLTTEALMSKWGIAGNRAYNLWLDGTDQFNFSVSDDGTNSTTATSTAISTFNVWYHVVGRFDPSAFVDVFVNGVEVNQATARAAAFNSSANFTIGAENGGTNPFQGRISMAWICLAQLSDSIIQNLYQQTRTAFNV